MQLGKGTKLQGGKYVIVRTLGQGGFGITYEAEQILLHRKVAIKEFFLKGSCQREASTSRVSIPVTDNKELVSKCLKKFKSEARKIASLNNDYIVSIIDIFDENGTSYYVMKYLDGGSLAERVRLSPFSEDQALQITREISSALKSIHSNGLLHLDIKPANILFDSQNRAVLIDFGISKYVDGQNDTTSSSSLIGFSRGFAPLEQINANMSSLSPASDIYSLGATLYNMVVGSAPPDATLVMDAGLPAFPAGISEDVQHAIEMAMQPRRKDRPQDIDAFLDLLPEEDFSDEDENTIVAVRQDTAKSDPSTKSKWLFYTALVLFVGAAVLAGVTFFQKSRTMASGSENKQLEQMENKVQALITKNDSLQQQMTVMKRQASNSDQSKKQLDDLQKKNADLSSQIASLRKENTNLKTQVSVYKTEAENNKADAEKWRRQLNANSRR